MVKRTTVLVTGATGHVGHELCRRVAAGGCDVHALVRSDDQAREVERQGWRPFGGDLRDPETLKVAVENVDMVLHCAASSSMDRPLAEVVNVEGTRSLASLALEAGASRFVHISTVSVYGLGAVGQLDEESPLAVEDAHPYVATKALGELALLGPREAGLVTVVLRPGAICNVTRSQWGDELVERLRSKGWPADLHPQDVLPWVHTVNLAEMAWLSLTHPAAENETFLAVDRNVTLEEYFGPIARALGQPVVVPDRPPVVAPVRLGKLSEKLGYSPLHSFEETMEGLLSLANPA